VDHSPPTGAEVTKTWIYTTTPTYIFFAQCLGKNRKDVTYLRRMVSSGMLRRVALVRTDVSEELSVSFIRVTRNDDYVLHL
jgi:hypothetical protein